MALPTALQGWGCGQGIGAIRRIEPARALVERLRGEYQAARARWVPPARTVDAAGRLAQRLNPGLRRGSGEARGATVAR